MADDKPLLDAWRQGDLCLDPIELPVLELDGEEPVIAFVNAQHGVVVVSQSCDIVREVADKPWVHVAALEEMPADLMPSIKLGSFPQFLHILPIEDRNLAANLDQLAIVHKDLVATWTRTQGCPSDADQRRVAAALARHRQRFAFPDAFNALVRPIRKWIEKKRNAQSPFGDFVRAITEVRVTTDDWDKPSEILFHVLMEQLPAPLPAEWTSAINTLQEKAKHDGYPDPEFRLATYDDISAREYRISDRLDWEGLSDS